MYFSEEAFYKATLHTVYLVCNCQIMCSNTQVYKHRFLNFHIRLHTRNFLNTIRCVGTQTLMLIAQFLPGAYDFKAQQYDQVGKAATSPRSQGPCSESGGEMGRGRGVRERWEESEKLGRGWSEGE